MAEQAKLLPSEVEIERFIISACLMDGNAIAKISYLSANDFYDSKNRTLFGVIKTIYTEGEDVSLTTVWDFCTKHNLDKQLPLSDLMEISNIVFTSVEIEKHAAIVKERSDRRKILSIAPIVQLAGTDMSMSPGEIIDMVQDAIDTTRNDSASSIPVIKTITDSIKNRIAVEESGVDVNIRTGFVFTDEQGGLHPSDLISIGAYPAVGKSALTAKMAYNIAIRDIPVAYYSLEMPAEQIICRLCSIVSYQQSVFDGQSQSLSVSQTISNMPPRTKEQTELFMQLLDEMNKLPMYVVDNCNTIADLTASIGEMVRMLKVKAVFIDYVQLIQNKSKMTREEHLGECCKILKGTAKRYGISIVLLTQLTQNSEKSDRRPHYYNAKGASSIYEASDMFITLDRPEADSCDGYVSFRSYEGKFNNVSINGTAEVKICKNKNGRTDSYILGFLPEFTDFHDLESYPKRTSVRLI